ncbi:MAG: crotonase/enoyl-CoA hydratase family protein [Pseudomonadota bacterium]
MTDHIQVSRDGAVQIIRFNRAEKKNAITDAMYHSLSEALEKGEADETVSVHILLGQSGVFTAGNDVADFMQFAVGAARLDEAGVARYLRLQPDITKPFLAGVDGVAVGIGTTLLFHCDMVFATPASQFSTPFVNLGLVAENASSLLAPRIMGGVRAFEMLALAERFDAERAREAGVINAVVEPDQLEAHVIETAQRLAAKPQQALRRTKALLKGDSTELHAVSRRESEIFAERLGSDEAREAFMAFMAR